MALFEYSAINHRGKSFKGVINADSIGDAKETLRMQNVVLTAIDSYASKKELALTKMEVLDFTRDLHQLLKASLPLYDALKTIADKFSESKNHSLFVEICDRIKQGKSLSHSLAQYPLSFSSVYVAMVEAAEESGALVSVFGELLRILSQESQLKKQLQSAMVYPAFLASFCVIVIIALFTFMIPSMKELLEGRQVHPFTQTILSLSDIFAHYKWFIFPGLIALIFSLVAFFKMPSGRKIWQWSLLKLPLIGKMAQHSILLKFSRTFSVLLSSGVPIVRAMEMSSKVMNHGEYEALIEAAKNKMVEGKHLSEELAKSSLIPPLMVKMIATAEVTATLDQMLSSIADIYQSELDKSLQQFSSLIQPVMILILGLIVGSVLLAVLLPLTDVSAFLT